MPGVLIPSLLRARTSRAGLGAAAAIAVVAIAGCGGGGGGSSTPKPAVLPGVPLAQSGPEGQAAARVALAYAVADARGKGAVTCSLVTPQILNQLNAQKGHCKKALTHPPFALAETSVTNVALTGNTAIAVLLHPGLPARQIALAKEADGWRVSNGGT